MRIEIQNEIEAGILEKFGTKVEDLEQDEITLLRFLRAREFDIDKAENMLRKSINWRKENRMDSILEWQAPEYLGKDLEYAITGFDNHGSPILWIPFGKWNHRPHVEQGYGDELLKWGYRLIEDGFQICKKHTDGRNQGIALFDLAEISYYKATYMPSLKILYTAFQALEANYPEIIKSIVIINAPWLFSIPFNFLKCVVSPNTLSKLKVFDSNKKVWLSYLLENIPQKSLPKEYFQDENGN